MKKSSRFLCMAAVRKAALAEEARINRARAASLRREAELLERDNPFSEEAASLYAEVKRLERGAGGL